MRPEAERSAAARLPSLLLVLALALVPMACDDESPTTPRQDVPIMNNFGSKIVYGTSPRMNLDALRADCAARQGRFNECGSVCAPDAQGCITVCAYTCENIPD